MRSFENPEDIILQWYYIGVRKRRLDLSRWNIDELPDMPDTVEYLNLSDTAIKHLKNLPKNLKWLRCLGSDIETIELPLPPNLTYLDVRSCKHLKPFDIPPHIECESDFAYFARKRKYKQERLTEEHNIVAKRRVNEWIEENRHKKQKTVLDLSRLQCTYLPDNIPYDVEWMNCGGNFKLESFKGLPKGLKRLDYDGYPHKEMLELPVGLLELNCSGCSLEILDNIPNTVRKIKISYYSHLRIVKSLPSELRELDLSICTDLEEIQCEFPKKLRKLDINMTYIESIPMLPDSLKIFDMAMNHRIKELPNLPKNLKSLRISSSCLKSLPPLPDGLLELYMDSLSILDNNSLPNTIRVIKSDELNLEENKTIITSMFYPKETL